MTDEEADLDAKATDDRDENVTGQGRRQPEPEEAATNERARRKAEEKKIAKDL